LLHYLTHDEQQAVLLEAIERSSGLVIVRDAVRDRTMRYRLTVAEETFARAVGWLRVPRLNFPSVEQIVAPFHAHGFKVSVAPMRRMLRFASAGWTNGFFIPTGARNHRLFPISAAIRRGPRHQNVAEGCVAEWLTPIVKNVARALRRSSICTMASVSPAGPSSIVSHTSFRSVSKRVTTGPSHCEFGMRV